MEKNEKVWLHCKDIEEAVKATSPDDKTYTAEFFYEYYNDLANFYDTPIESIMERSMAINGVGFLRPPRK